MHDRRRSTEMATSHGRSLIVLGSYFERYGCAKAPLILVHGQAAFTRLKLDSITENESDPEAFTGD